MMKKRLISMLSALALVLSLFTMLPEGVLKAEAATYLLKVAGIQVTSENKSDILGNGEASYNSTTKTLTLNDDITNPDPSILGCVDNEIDGLTIIAKNDVTLTSDQQAIRSVGHNLTIKGGKYTLDAQRCGIYCSNCTVTIKDADIETTSNCKWGISGGKTNDKLIINNSKVKVNENPDCYCAVGEFASEIELLNCFVSSPEGGFPGKYATNNYCIMKSTYVRATQVTITPFDLSLGNTPLTYENHEDILEDGTANFDYETNTLTLNGTQTSGRFGLYNRNVKGLKIVVNGECGFSSGNNATAGLNLLADTTVTGTGKVYFTSTAVTTGGSGIILGKNTTLTLDSASVIARGTITGIKGREGSKLVVNNSDLTAEGLSETDGVGIDGVAGGITLDGSKYKTPVGAVIKEGTVYNTNGRTKANKVEIEKGFTVTFSGTNAYIDQEPNPYKKLTSGDEVKVGSKVRLIYDSDVSIPTGKYVTSFTSNQVTIQKDGSGYYFIMPAKSVTVNPTYATQQSHVIDLSSGNAVKLSGNEAHSLYMLSEYTDKLSYIIDKGFDLDKNGTADVLHTYDSATNSESLVRLSTNSVEGDITFDVKNAPYSPLTFRMTKAHHSITVQNGTAYDVNGYKILTAAEGDTVYIKFDETLTPDGKYIGGGSVNVSVSEIASYIYVGGGYDYGFTMPTSSVNVSPIYYAPLSKTVDVSNGTKLTESDGTLLSDLAKMGLINYTGNFSDNATFDLDKDGHADIFFNYYYSKYGNALGTTNLTGKYVINVPKNYKYSPITFIFDNKKYDLYVAHTQVTSENCKDILGDGVFSYDPTTNILDVNGNCTSILDNTIRNGINGLIVRINKDCTFAEGLLLDANTTVTGNGKLTINVPSGHLGFVIRGNDHTLTFDNANIVINGGSNSIITENGNTNSLIIINSSISAESNYGFTTNTFKQVTFTDCVLVTPSDGFVRTTGFYNSDGTSSPTKVEIVPKNVRRQVGDVNGDGKVSADDAIIVARYAANYSNYRFIYYYDYCDMNRDGNVTADDAIIIARYAANYGNYKDIYTNYVTEPDDIL